MFGDDGPFLRRCRVTGQLVHPQQGELVEARGSRLEGQLRSGRSDGAPVLIRPDPREGEQGGESRRVRAGRESFRPPRLERLPLQRDAGGTAQPRVRRTEVGPGLCDSVPIDPAVKTLELFPELARGSSITGIGDGLFARFGTIDFFPGVANAIERRLCLAPSRYEPHRARPVEVEIGDIERAPFEENFSTPEIARALRGQVHRDDTAIGPVEREE